MITALIIWLFKKYGHQFKNGNRNTVWKAIIPVLRRGTALVGLILLSSNLLAQVDTVKYKIVYNGKVVGHMDYYQTRSANDLNIKIISEVNTCFIMNIKVNVNEESTFKNGKLTASNVNRKVNGKEKANKQTKALGNNYLTSAEGKNGLIKQNTIDYNLMMLYSREPINNAVVYSDNFQQFLRVKQTGEHIYRVDLPDGNYNFYSYTNGICSKVDVHHSFYTFQIQLV